MASTAWQRAGADPLIPAPTTGTATGTYRTGLAKAGLVSLESLGNTHLWIGKKSLLGDDPQDGRRYDLRVELLNNGTPVSTTVQRCLGPFGLDASEVVVPWNAFDAPTLSPGDVLSLRVSTRIGTKENDSPCRGKGDLAGMRVFYDGTSSASRFDATITPSPSVALYLHSDGAACGAPAGETSLSEDVPAAASAKCRDSANLKFDKNGNPWKEVATWSLAAQAACANQFIPEVRNAPPAPAPETIVLERLPLPPPPTGGACDLGVNPQGCISAVNDAGVFIDPDHALANLAYSGAATSIFNGNQLVAIKTNGGTFSNGTPWKCLTCGIPTANRNGLSNNAGGSGGYPMAFRDGHRIIASGTIYRCDEPWVSDACTPANTYRYPIRWNVTPDGSGAGGSIRELKISPDDVHLGFSHFTLTGVTQLQQFGYVGRLVFNPAPTTGTPLVPRYDVVNVSRLYGPDQVGPVWPDPDHPGELIVNSFARELGELKGWSKDGKWVGAIPYPAESNNPDVTMISLEGTGEVRRLQRSPGYGEVLDLGYDPQWQVFLDTRGESGTRFGTGKELFFDAMPGIPPIIDLLTTGIIASIRDNIRPAPSADFTPILADIYADRGAYVGQALKATSSCPVGSQGTGSLCDGTNWNTTSEAWWSQDSTTIIYREQNFGGAATTLEPGGRNTRLVIARLVDRQPKPYTPPAPTSDSIPWAIPYTPGDPDGYRSTFVPPAGTYTVRGAVFGTAEVTLQQDLSGPQPAMSDIAVSYDNFSYDGINVINGTEHVFVLPERTLFTPALEWHSALALSGCDQGTKATSEPGGYRIRTNVLAPVGSLRTSGSFVTTINGMSWSNPPALPY